MIQPSPVNALRETMKVINNSKVISGLRLKKKRAEVMWMGSSRKSKAIPLSRLNPIINLLNQITKENSAGNYCNE